jgi:hypothetical protein
VVPIRPVDLHSTAYFDDPFPLWERLRHDQPLFHDTVDDRWLLTRYDDVASVFRDHDTYSTNGSSISVQSPSARREISSPRPIAGDGGQAVHGGSSVEGRVGHLQSARGMTGDQGAIGAWAREHGLGEEPVESRPRERERRRLKRNVNSSR